MKANYLPIISGPNFQILKAKKNHGNWQVEVKLGAVKRSIEVEGDEEAVLQVVEALSEKTIKGHHFKIVNNEIKSESVSIKAPKTNPLLLKIFRTNLA